MVLVGIGAPEQARLAVERGEISVVPRSHPLRAERLGVVLENVELDFPVAQHVRVRRAPRLVFGEKVLEYGVPVFCGEVRCLQGNLQAIGHSLGIG